MANQLDSTVVAVFKNPDDARRAVAELKSQGFGGEDIYVSDESFAASSTSHVSEPSNKANEGGVKGWFKSLFGTDEHSDYRGYERAVAGGGTVVSVDVDEDKAEAASEILNRFSPLDLHTEDFGESQGVATGNVYDSGYQANSSDLRNAQQEMSTPTTTTGSVGYDAAAGAAARNAYRTSTTGGDNQTIPVVREDLLVGKRTVERGGVRVYSRVVEEPVEERINLREERVRVDRQPVSRKATEADFQTGRDQVIEVREYAEEPVVSKQARVVEEVRLNKDSKSRTETVKDSVRRTEVDVQDMGPGSSYDDDYRTHFATSPGSSGLDYDDYAPAYRYGSEIANDDRYRGKSFDAVESDLRSDYGRQYPNSTWEKMKDSVRYGWDKVTGNTKTASQSR